MDIEIQPQLLHGTIKEITDVGARIGIDGRMGVLSLPLRCIFCDKPLELGQKVEFYLSYVKVIS